VHAEVTEVQEVYEVKKEKDVRTQASGVEIPAAKRLPDT
jgi:hypothetical protein